MEGPDHDFSQDLEQQKRYFRMHMTILQMLKDRGYNVDDDELEFDFQSWADIFVSISQLNNTYTNDTDPEKYPQVKVKFDPSGDKIKSDAVKEWIAESKREGHKRLILIAKDGVMTEMVKRYCERMRTDPVCNNLHVEFFGESEVLINITQHSLVPRHEVLTDEEKEELLNHYQIEGWQLPKIFKNDPVVRYYGVDVGTVLKITRKSETSGRYVTYRLVC